MHAIIAQQIEALDCPKPIVLTSEQRQDASDRRLIAEYTYREQIKDSKHAKFQK